MTFTSHSSSNTPRTPRLGRRGKGAPWRGPQALALAAPDGAAAAVFHLVSFCSSSRLLRVPASFLWRFHHSDVEAFRLAKPRLAPRPAAPYRSRVTTRICPERSAAASVRSTTRMNAALKVP